MVKKYYQPPHIDTDTNSGKLAFNVDVDQLEDYWSAEDLKSIIEQTGTIATPVQVRMRGKNIDWTIFRVLLGERLFTFLVVNTLIRNLTLRKFAKLYPGIMNYLKSTFGDAEWNEKNIERRFGDILKEMRQVHPGTGGIFQIAYQSTNEPFQEEIRACFRRLEYSKLPDAFKNKWKKLVDQDRFNEDYFNEDYYENMDDFASDENSTTTTTTVNNGENGEINNGSVHEEEAEAEAEKEEKEEESSEDREDDNETNNTNTNNNGDPPGLPSPSATDDDSDKNHDDDKSEDTHSSNGNDSDFVPDHISFTDDETNMVADGSHSNDDHKVQQQQQQQQHQRHTVLVSTAATR